MRKAFDAIKLIYLVRERRALYDARHQCHRDKPYLTSLWQEVAYKLHITEREAKMKWQNLRSNYCRERRKLEIPGPPEYKTTWPYFELMTFLDEFSRSVTKRRKSSESESILVPDDEDEPEIIVPDVGDISTLVNGSLPSVVTNETGLLSLRDGDRCFPVITSATSLLGKRTWNSPYFIECNEPLVPVILTPGLLPSTNANASTIDDSTISIDSSNKVARLHTECDKSSISLLTEKCPASLIPSGTKSSWLFPEENRASGLSDCSDEENLYIDETSDKDKSDKDEHSTDSKVTELRVKRTKENSQSFQHTSDKPSNNEIHNYQISITESPGQESETSEAHDSNYESLSDRPSTDGDSDPDMLFLRSLMPSIRELSHVYNLEFKEEVLQLLKRKLILSSTAKI